MISIDEKSLTNSDYQRLLKYPWFYPEASKKSKKYLTKWLKEIDVQTIDSPLVGAKSITKAIYSLEAYAKVSHVDMILTYVNGNGTINFLNINKLIIHRQVSGGYYEIQLNGTKLTQLINRILKIPDVTKVFLPIVWISQHTRLEKINISWFYAFVIPFDDNSKAIENYFEGSIYDKCKDKRIIYKNFQKLIEALTLTY